MSTITMGLKPNRVIDDVDFSQSHIKVLDYGRMTTIPHTDNAVTTFTEDGVILFHNPHEQATVYDLPMFNGELYNSNDVKILDLNYSTNNPTTTISVYEGMKYKCLKWSVITVYADTSDEVGTLQTVSTDCELYFVPFKTKLNSTYNGVDSSNISGSSDYVAAYNAALGDTSALDRILGLGESGESESES